MTVTESKGLKKGTPALTCSLTLSAREAERAGRGDGPPTPRRQVFHLFAGAVDDRPASSSSCIIELDRSAGRCRAMGSISTTPPSPQHRDWVASCARAQIGGSAAGADCSEKIARVNLFPHPQRARGGASRAWRWPTDAAPTGFSPIRWRRGRSTCIIELLHHRVRPVGRPLPSYGVACRQHLLRRSTETGLLAALAPRIGGSAAGADCSAEIARVNLFLTLSAREAERAGRGDGPPTPRRQVFRLFAGAVAIDLHRSSSCIIELDRSAGRCRAMGSIRQHPLRRSTETGLLAALAPRIGGSAAGADCSAEIGPR